MTIPMLNMFFLLSYLNLTIMVGYLGQISTQYLKELPSALYDRPIEEANPCEKVAYVVGTIKECHDSSVRPFFFWAGI
jgi:hypothetical protein